MVQVLSQALPVNRSHLCQDVREQENPSEDIGAQDWMDAHGAGKQNISSKILVQLFKKKPGSTVTGSKKRSMQSAS
jgi:hypothetical protein